MTPAFLGGVLIHSTLSFSSSNLKGTLESLGVPVHLGRLHAACVGPDEDGENRRIYLAFSQAQNRPPFLLIVNPDTGEMAQYYPPQACDIAGLKSLYLGQDGVMYVGSFSPARLLRFDPGKGYGSIQDEAQIEDMGLLPGASMIWWMMDAADGNIYLSVSGGAGLFSWNPSDGTIRNHGKLSEENEYATWLVRSEDGWTLYAVVAPERYDVVAYDVRTGQRRGLLSEQHRGTGFISICRGDQGFLYANLPNNKKILVDKVTVHDGLPWNILEDGRRFFTDYEILNIVAGDGTSRSLPLRYEAETEIFHLHEGPDGKVYASTHAPLRFCRYDPTTGQTDSLGNPFVTADGDVGASLNYLGKIYMAAYQGSDLTCYDPARPWKKGHTGTDNPWTWGKPVGEGHTIPVGLVAGVDRLLYLASDSSYGISGGALACLDPKTGRTVYNLREPFDERSIASLAADPEKPLLYVGCKKTSAEAAAVLCWNTRDRRIAWISVPSKEGTSISSLVYLHGMLYGSAMKGYEAQSFFAMEAVTGKVIHKRELSLPAVIRGNLKLGPDGWLYGLTYQRPTFFRIHPEKYVLEQICKPPRADGYAMAVTADGLYFAYDGMLMRFRFSRPLSKSKLK